MIRFKLNDENSDKDYKYSFEIDFENLDEFDEWEYPSGFELFMEKMECGRDAWCGVHDFGGGRDKDGTEWIGYSSYEIKDFPTALEKWKEFFKSKNKLI